jgi:hypothetical protein
LTVSTPGLTHRFEIVGLTPWAEFNEYEGAIEGNVHGRRLIARVVMNSGGTWSQYRPGQYLDAKLQLERDDQIARLASPETSALIHGAGVRYTAVGRVQYTLPMDRLVLDVGFPLVVDPSWCRDVPPFQVAAGDWLRVSGELGIDLGPD